MRVDFKEGRGVEIIDSVAQAEAVISNARRARGEFLYLLAEKFPGKVLSEPETLSDREERDDAGKNIEALVRLRVSSVEEVAVAVQFALEHNMAVMMIGAKTSALGVFQADNAARKQGFEGILGLELSDRGCAGVDESPFMDENFEVLATNPGRIIKILRSKKFPEIAHRVVAHAGVTIGAINDFLNENLQKLYPTYAFRLMADPTSKAEATLGGVIATGAEGGNRVQAADDLLGLKVVNADAEVKILREEEAKKVVGLNGNAGLCVEACFEVSAFPKFEHAVFVPARGNGEQAWQNALRLQECLKVYALPHGENRRLQLGDPQKNQIILTGVELLSASALALEQGDPLAVSLLKMMGESELGLYVTFSSNVDCSFDDTDQNFLQQSIFKDLGVDFAKHESDSEGMFLLDDSAIAKGVFVFAEERTRKKMSDLRHGVPARAREEGRKLGGITESTDLNLRFSSPEPVENSRAMSEVARIYNNFVQKFGGQAGVAPFKMQIYGHLHPGNGQGGGIDPHIRVTLDLTNFADETARLEVPEMVLMMKKMQEHLYSDLLALDGVNGVQILAPEKSVLTNEIYYRWLCLNHKERVLEYQAIMKKYGVNREGRPLIAFRLPYELPDRKTDFGKFEVAEIQDLLDANLVDATEGDLFKKYWRAILELSQHSHRKPRIQRLLRATLDEVRWYLDLRDDQYAFFIESPEEAGAILVRNFGQNFARSLNVKVVDLHSEEKICEAEDDSVYVIERGGDLPKGLSLLVVSHSLIQRAYAEGALGRKKPAFRNLFEMWKGLPYETGETPNLPLIALLGLYLQEKRQFSSHEIAPQAVRDGVKGKLMITLNPGPAQISEHLKRDFDYLVDFQAPESQQRAIEKFRKYMKIPEDYGLAFHISATQMMQVLADALKFLNSGVNVISVTNDAFSDRLYAVLSAELKDVDRIKTPWRTGEKTYLSKVAEEVFAKRVEGKPMVLCVTPHKTSTAVSFHPQILVDELTRRGMELHKDYFLVCDITSGAGGIDYGANFSMAFGGGQKALGLPAGLSFAFLHPKFLELLVRGANYEDNRNPGEDIERFSLLDSVTRAANGDTLNPLALAMLARVVAHNEMAGVTPETICRMTREKLDLILQFCDSHGGVKLLVPNEEDYSPILAGLTSDKYDMPMVAKLLADLFNYHLGEGYGPFSAVSLRSFLANVTEQQLKEVLVALRAVLKMPEALNKNPYLSKII